jgi:hypothetical protein
VQFEVQHFNRSELYSICLFACLIPSLELNVALWLEMYSLQGNIDLVLSLI